ncbi:MAG: hypothetical protein PVF51_00875 [Nitrospirota bacterium]|jgi:hypothetical protein
MSYSTKGVHEVADGINYRTHTKLPLGWVIMTVGLIAFAFYYIFANIPQWGGWSAYTALQKAHEQHEGEKPPMHQDAPGHE